MTSSAKWFDGAPRTPYEIHRRVAIQDNCSIFINLEVGVYVTNVTDKSHSNERFMMKDSLKDS